MENIRINLTEEQLTRIISEALDEYRFNHEDATGDIDLSIDEIIERMPDCDIKERLQANSELADELLPGMAYDYRITLVGDVSVDTGDYWTPPDRRVENIRIKNDDGLLENIRSIGDEALRGYLMQAYQNFVEEVNDGMYDNYLEYN